MASAEAEVQAEAGPELTLDPKTASHRLLECTRCHEPVASKEWAGRMTVRCESCSFEEERELTLEQPLVDALGEPYRDPPRARRRSKKLTVDLAAAMPGSEVKSLDPAKLRALLARRPLVDFDLDDRADFEWKAVWTGVWLALMQALAGNPLRARISLETTLLATRTPVYRALLLTHLAQHAAALGATGLSKKWLRACPDVSVAEVESEVRVARAMIALAKGKVDDVLRQTGDRRAGEGFTRHAGALAIALNLEAHDRLGDHKVASEILADVTRKKLLAMVLVPALAFQIGTKAIARMSKRNRWTTVVWAAVGAALPLVSAPSIRQISVRHTVMVMAVVAVCSALVARSNVFTGIATRFGLQGVKIFAFLVPIACAVLGYVWIFRTHPPLPTVTAPAPPSPPQHVLALETRGPNGEAEVVPLDLTPGMYEDLDEGSLMMSAQMAMLSQKYLQAEHMARECLRRNGANRECAGVLAAAVESQR